MTGNSTPLLILLALELLAAAWLVMFYLLRSPSRITATRVTQFSAPKVKKTFSHQKKPRFLVRLCMFDLNKAQREAIPLIFGPEGSPNASQNELFIVGRVAFSVATWLTGYLLFTFLLSDWGVHAAFVITLSSIFGAVGWWGTSKYLSGLAQDRRNSISAGMPYALDLILICLDSGTALETAIARVAEELSARDPMVSAELLRTLTDINVIGNRELAFRNLGDRIGTDNMHSIVGVLCQSLQYGSSLSVALKGAIENMKRVELITLEERAGKLPVQLTMPGLIFTFPQVIVLLAGPGVLSLLDTLANT